MDLSRRDALAALAATGVAGVAGATLLDGEDGATAAAGDSTPSDDTATASDDGLAILVAVAETVYPAAAEGVDTFVETYVSGLPDDRQDDVFAVAAELGTGRTRPSPTSAARPVTASSVTSASTWRIPTPTATSPSGFASTS